MTKPAPSPGEHLKNTLKEIGMKNAELATLMGRSPQYVTDIIKGKKAMDVDLAIDLDRALKGRVAAADWMQIAIQHRLRSQEPTRSDVLARYPYAKEMIKLKWIDGTKGAKDLDQELKEFWDLQGVAANFKQSPAHIVNEYARRAWAIQVNREANSPAKNHVGPYDPNKFDDLIKALKKLMIEHEDVKKVQDTIEAFGIRCVYLPNPKQCPVDGIASLNPGPDGERPYIGLSLRIARLDSFWFTVLHELMHIKRRHSNVAPDTIDATPDDDECEVQANQDAGEAILPDATYQAFIKRGDFSLIGIKSEAYRQGLHHSILIGRMKRDHFLDWSQFAREHPGVRELLLTEAA